MKILLTTGTTDFRGPFTNDEPAKVNETDTPITAVGGRLAAGDVAGVQQIITLSGAGMSQDVATARTAMLALISQLFGENPPSKN